MKTRKAFAAWLAAGLVMASVWLTLGLAADPPAPGVLVVIDANGKEQKLKTWKFTTGVRHLSWLTLAAPDKEPGDKDAKPGDKDAKPGGKDAKPDDKVRGLTLAPPKPRPPAVATGPEALEFRDENSTTFVDGILTLIPLDRLRSLEYDSEQETVTAKVATGEKGEAEATLTGSTKFRGINKLALEAEVDKGDLGVAELKFLGGVPKGIRGVRFPAAKAPAAAPAGRPATVTSTDGKKKAMHKVSDLQALYKVADGERLSPILRFKKTLKVDLAKVQKLSAIEGGEGDGAEWQVVLKDGTDETLTLLRAIDMDGKPATLAGFLARVPAGYVLFPAHTVAEIQLDEAKPEPKTEKTEKPETKP